VVIEASVDVAGAPLDDDDVVRLLDAVSDHTAVALHGTDRLALQLHLQAATPAGAMDAAMACWEAARARTRLSGLDFVRAEVVTAAEFERECAADQGSGVTACTPAHGGAADVATAAERELLQRALHDPLTGLPGEGLFRGFVDQALAEAAARRDVWPALLRLDLDDFAAVERTAGRAAADEALRMVAARLVAASGPDEPVARLGGDQFAVLAAEGREQRVQALAARLLAAVRLPLSVQGERLAVTASIGSAEALPCDTSEDLLRRAGLALATAKHGGKDRHQRFRPGLRPVTADRLDAEARATFDLPASVGLLARVAVAANESASLAEAARTVLHQVCTHTGWPVGVLHVLDEGSGQLVPTESWQLTPERFEPFRASLMRLRFGPGEGLPGAVLDSGQPAWSDTGPEVAGAGPAAARLRGSFAVPVKVGRQVVAVLEFFSEVAVHLDGSLVDVLASVGTQLGRVVERARAGAALRVAEAALREVVAQARLGQWRVDLGSGEAECSDELYAIFGFVAGERPPWQALLAVVHPDDRAPLLDRIAEVMEAAGSAPLPEFRVVRPDGSVRWLAGRALVVAGTGLPATLHGTVQDVTDRKHSEEQLRHAQERLRGAEDLAGVGWWYTDVESGRSTWSDAVYRMLGHEPGSCPPAVDTFLRAVHPCDRDLVRERRRILYETGTTGRFEYRVVLPDGEVRWLSNAATGIRGRSGQLVALHGTVQDVTERKRAESALAAADRRWYALVGERPALLALVAGDGSAEFVSLPAGTPDAAPAPATLASLAHPDDAPVLADLLARAARGEAVEPAQVRLPGAGGQVRWFEVEVENYLADPSVAALVVRAWEVAEPEGFEVPGERPAVVTGDTTEG
jgi:diguanylate cyclase (GGDEF)-like protein/PAS domain S-box-containing protein